NRLGDLVEGFERLIDLEPVSSNLIGTGRTGVRSFGHEPTDVVQQPAHLAQSAVGRGDNFVRPVRIADGLGDARDIAAQIFAGDQTGRIGFTRVSPPTGD